MRKGRDTEAWPALWFGADERDDLAKDRLSAGEGPVRGWWRRVRSGCE